ncbi:pyrimidine-nucleoside phosphorylase, partial [Streptococcus pyogenes]
VEDLHRSVKVAYEVDVFAEKTGYISGLPALEFGLFAMKLGAGRAVKSDDLDYESGIVFAKKVGQSVEKDEKIATIYSNIAITNDMIS